MNSSNINRSAQTKILFLVLFGLMSLAACVNDKGETMNESMISTLATTDDPTELANTAVELSASADALDIRALTAQLVTADFLNRLDSADDYLAPARTLRVAQVVDELGRNQSPAAVAAFIELTQSEVFLSHLARREVLIGASAHVAPPPDPLVAFWRANAGAEDTSKSLVIKAVIQNGSDEGAKVFEAKMLDATEDFDTKEFWLIQFVVPNRNSTALARSAERLLSSPLSDNVKVRLVSVLFDYRGAWYRPSNVAKPPVEPPDELTEVQLQRVARLAMTSLELPEYLQQKMVERFSATQTR
jgi:hypothetical protein